MEITRNVIPPQYLKEFILGGNAYFTAVSTPTCKKFTFRVREKKTLNNGTLYFVSFMSLPQHYVFMGTIFDESIYRISNKSKFPYGTLEQTVFIKIWDWVKNNSVPGEHMIRFFHEGRCARCGYRLTDPISIIRGFGPCCFKKITANQY